MTSANLHRIRWGTVIRTFDSDRVSRVSKAGPLRVRDARIIGSFVEPVTVDCEALRESAPQAVGATCFEADPDGPAYPVTVKFLAKRLGVRGRGKGHQERTQYERIDHVVPGSGRVSVTTRFEGDAPGEWQIVAAPANNPREAGIPPGWANPTPLRLARGGTVVES